MVPLNGLYGLSFLLHAQACAKVVKYINDQMNGMRDGLDGKNVDAVLTELGIRCHRVVYDHLLQFQYNSMGKTHTRCTYRTSTDPFLVRMTQSQQLSLAC